MKIVSACLLGINCRYDGKNNRNEKVVELARKEILIPVCPEQLGGLPTPRESCEQQQDGRLMSESGKDFTNEFNRGAEETLRIANTLGIKEAIMAFRSPSCGCGKVYDGTFTHTLIDGDGVTTALLKKNGIKTITEREL